MSSQVANEIQFNAVVQGRLDACCVRGSPPAKATGRLIFPGAFNPLHQGHREMAALSAAQREQTVEFEISIHNVDKQSLTAQQIHARLQQFQRDDVVWLTRANTFVKKANSFPQATFVVGVDTIERIADVHYYGGSRVARDKALAQLRDQGCRFLVFGRKQTRSFRGLYDCQLPPSLLELCSGVPEASFRRDLASRDLRAGGDQRLKDGQ